MTKPTRSLWVLTLVLLLLPPLARAEQAPAGQFLPNTNFSALPTPIHRYETRTGWIMATFRDNIDSGGPIARMLNHATMPPAAKGAMARERAAVDRLSGPARATYMHGLARDMNRMEITGFDAKFSGQIISTVFVDLAASAAADLVGSYIGSAFGNQYIDDLRKIAARNQAAGATKTLAELIDRIERGGAGVLMGSAERDAAIAMIERHAKEFGEGVAKHRVFKEELAAIFAKSLPSPASTNLFTGYMNQPDAAVAETRRQAVSEFIIALCKCLTTGPPGLDAPAAWETFLPNVRGTYRTRLGRLIAASQKSGFRLALGATRLKQELNRINTLKRENPGGFALLLARFLQDVDSLQAELIKDLRDQNSFAEAVFVDGVAGLLTFQGTPAANFASMLGTAIITGIEEYGKLSAERKLLVLTAGWRSTAMDSLANIKGGCGCRFVSVAVKTVKAR